jgi:hypothetical protein
MAKQSRESVFVYVVARDFGFAPNPFHGFCTLACCKPRIRSVADVGDWVFGVAGGDLAQPGHCIFGMRVTETLTFDEYWLDPRFEVKKPLRNGSRVMMLGDNIYHRQNASVGWRQEDSHHSRPDGSPDASNIATDTQTNRVLVSEHFTYFGASAPSIPVNVQDAIGYSNGRNHRRFSALVAQPPPPSAVPQRTVCQINRGVKIGRRSPRLRGQNCTPKHNLTQVVAEIRAAGATSLRAIGAELNARGMMPRRGGRWQVSNVRNLLRRLG